MRKRLIRKAIEAINMLASCPEGVHKSLSNVGQSVEVVTSDRVEPNE